MSTGRPSSDHGPVYINQHDNHRKRSVASRALQTAAQTFARSTAVGNNKKRNTNRVGSNKLASSRCRGSHSKCAEKIYFKL